MPKFLANIWYLPPLLTVLPMVIGPLVAHFHVVPPFKGFMTFVASLLPAMISVVIGLILVLTGAGGKGLTCLMVGALPIAAVLVSMAQGRHFPRINDIATNLDNPPVLVAAAVAPENNGKDLTYPEDFKDQVREAYPDLIALQLPLPAEQAFAAVRKTFAAHPEWPVSRVDPASLTVEGTETAGLFQFTDDFVVRILPMEQSSQVDVRSRSRVGQGDFGANANRVRRLLAAISATQQTP